MKKIIAAVCLGSFLLGSMNLAIAREGSVRSVGNGIKCYYNSVLKQQVCYKGV